MPQYRSDESEEFRVALDKLRARIRQASATGWSGVESAPATDRSPEDDPAAALLLALELEERELSRRRRQLHARIDTLQAAPVPLNLTFAAQLDAYKRAEVVVSANRRRLHREIDMLSELRPTAWSG